VEIGPLNSCKNTCWDHQLALFNATVETAAWLHRAGTICLSWGGGLDGLQEHGAWILLTADGILGKVRGKKSQDRQTWQKHNF